MSLALSPQEMRQNSIQAFAAIRDVLCESSRPYKLIKPLVDVVDSMLNQLERQEVNNGSANQEANGQTAQGAHPED